MTDSELLQSFVRKRDQTAFGELVRRHIDLVYSTALRHVHGDAHAAQDVAQEVLTDLVRKAPRLINHPCLAGWLYAGTRFAALETTRRIQRRVAREKEAEMIYEPTTAIADWDRVRPIIDDALQELNERDRELIVLRYFGRQSFFAIAAQCGLTENAAQKAVSRALDVLNGALARRGIASTGAALSLALAKATSATPAAITQAVLAGAMAGGTAGVAGLTLSTLKIVASAVAVATVSVAIGYSTGLQRQRAHEVEQIAATAKKYEQREQTLEQRWKMTDERLHRAEADANDLVKETLRLRYANTTVQIVPSPVATRPLDVAAVSATIYGRIKALGRVYVGSNGATLNEVVERAGGLTELANRHDVRVIRHGVPPESEVVSLDLDRDGATYIVHPGDTVYVRERIL